MGEIEEWFLKEKHIQNCSLHNQKECKGEERKNTIHNLFGTGFQSICKIHQDNHIEKRKFEFGNSFLFGLWMDSLPKVWFLKR